MIFVYTYFLYTRLMYDFKRYLKLIGLIWSCSFRSTRWNICRTIVYEILKLRWPSKKTGESNVERAVWTAQMLAVKAVCETNRKLKLNIKKTMLTLNPVLMYSQLFTIAVLVVVVVAQYRLVIVIVVVVVVIVIIVVSRAHHSYCRVRRAKVHDTRYRTESVDIIANDDVLELERLSPYRNRINWNYNLSVFRGDR